MGPLSDVQISIVLRDFFFCVDNAGSLSQVVSVDFFFRGTIVPYLCRALCLVWYVVWLTPSSLLRDWSAVQSFSVHLPIRTFTLYVVFANMHDGRSRERGSNDTVVCPRP